MTTRGLRNNNPGNLEKNGTPWQGQILPGQDERFCQFESMVMGCRALMKTLVTYHKVHHLDTVRQIITRWAPPTENDTSAYMKHVASAIKKDIDEKIPFDTDPTYYLAIARVIARHENGLDAAGILDETWDEAFEMLGF